LGIAATGSPYLWTVDGSFETITLNFVDITGSSVVGSLPGFGIRSAQPFLNATNTRLRTMASQAPSRSGDTAKADSFSATPPVSANADGIGLEIWAQGYGEGGDVDTQAGVSGYDYGTTGAAFGVDQWLDENLLVGIFGGWGTSTLDSNTADADAETWRVGMHVMSRCEKAYVMGSFHYGTSEYDVERWVPLMGVKADSDFNGHELAGYGEIGFMWAVASTGITAQPSLGFQYIDLQQNRHTESNAGASNLIVGKQKAESARLSAGILLSMDFEIGFGNLKPYVEGRYAHDFKETSAVQSVNFVGGGPGFVARGVSPGEDFAEVRAGGSLDLNKTVTLYGGFEGRYSSDSVANGGFGGVRLNF
jgi:outer membrane autotransporter protein